MSNQPMRDPHVVSLSYRIKSAKNVTFRNPPPVEYETESFCLKLAKGIACFELKEHFPTEEAARSVIDGFVRSWEVDAALKSGSQEIEFVLQNVRIIDREPPPADSPHTIFAEGILTSRVTASVSAGGHLTRCRYPAPPEHFRASRDVEILWKRYEGYTRHREPLLSMAYFCLSWIESRTGSKNRRSRAAKKYYIGEKVLNKLGELTATTGDERTARKITRASTVRAPTTKERIWIEAAIKAMIRRVGEIDSASSQPEITMNDLPEL